MKFVSVLKKLKMYTIQNPLVHSVSLGDIYENLNGKLDIVYGNVNFDIASVTRNEGLINYNVYVYYTDRLLQDKSNWPLVKDTAETVLSSIVNFASTELGDVQDGYTITFFEQQFADYCAGGWVNFILEVQNELGDCEMEGFDPEYPGLTLTITENGVYNVEEYARAVVDVIPHWGNIQGDITEQEDLVEALNTKVDKSDNLTIVYGTDEEGNQITYTAGEGIAFENGEIKNTNTEAAWGNITGDINDQTDLKNALDAKQDVLTPGANIDISNGVISAVDTIYDDTEIRGLIASVSTNLSELDDFTCGPIVPTTTNFVEGTTYTVHEALQRTANLFGGFQGEIDDINALIPNQATTQNQLADKDFVNSTVATNAANFRGNWADWANVPTDASQYPEDYAGNRTPTNNDYMVVQNAGGYVDPTDTTITINFKTSSISENIITIEDLSTSRRVGVMHIPTTTSWRVERQIFDYDLYIIYDSPNWIISSKLKPFVVNGVTYNVGSLFSWSYTETVDVNADIKSINLQGSWRFIYVGDWVTNGKNGWNPQYQIGSAFTAAQQAAIDSGITSSKVATYDGYNSKITALRTDKLDKVYTASKIYGTNTLGQQTTYTAGSGISFANNQINTSFDITEYIHQGDNNIETNTPLYFNSEKDGASYVCIRNDHAELVGKTLHKTEDEYFDRGVEYRISPDKVIFQSVTTDSEGNVENWNAQYKQTSKKIELTGEHVVLKSVNNDSNIDVGVDIKLSSPVNIKNSANTITNVVQNRFSIYQNSGEKCVDINKNGTHILTRLDVFEPERGNSLRLKKDGFETSVINSYGKKNWMKMTAGGNPFAFGVVRDPSINDSEKTAFLNTLPDGRIYIYDVDGYDGISTAGHRSLQNVISDLESDVSNITDDIDNLQNNKQDALEAGDGININGNEVSVDIDYIKQEISEESRIIKLAQIRLTAWDTTERDKLTAYVTTPIDRYLANAQGTGTDYGGVTNLDFDIEYDYNNPLVTIAFMNEGRYSTESTTLTGFWLEVKQGGFDSLHFTQEWKPSVIAYIPFYTYHYNGSYAGVTFQVNLRDYDLQRDGRIQLCYIQTSTMCYAEDTLITLSDGTTKKVQDITYNDILKVWNFDEGKSDSAKPIWIKVEQTANQYALVKLSDGNSIKLVGTDGKYHCMYDMDEQKFNHAIDCIGHNVYTENGIVKVESLEIVNEPVKFYNIVTNVHLNCYANHILTSTEKNNIYPINDMKFVKDNREFKPYEAFENYGISLDDYNGWRLAEQPMSVEECIKFVKQRKQTQL